MIFKKLKIENWKLKILAKQAGFTVLESIVAIAVLSLAISGAFSAVQQSLSQAIIAKDEVKAFYLAQEAFEMIRNKRDSNLVANINNGPVDWLDGITDADKCPFNNTCRVNADSSFEICGAAWDSCPVLKQDTGGSNPTYLYGYTSGIDTNFKREIQIESINADEISVTVQISWTKGILPFTFKVKTLLLNWI